MKQRHYMFPEIVFILGVIKILLRADRQTKSKSLLAGDHHHSRDFWQVPHHTVICRLVMTAVVSCILNCLYNLDFIKRHSTGQVGCCAKSVLLF